MIFFLAAEAIDGWGSGQIAIEREWEWERDDASQSLENMLTQGFWFSQHSMHLGTLGKSLAPSQSLGRGGGSFSKPLVTCCCHFQQIPQQFASTQLQRIGDMKCSRLVVVLGAMFIYDASKSYQTLLMASFSLNLCLWTLVEERWMSSFTEISSSSPRFFFSILRR